MRSQRLHKVKRVETRSMQSFTVTECVVGAGPKESPGLGKLGPVSHIFRWLTTLFTFLISMVALPQSKEEHSPSESSVDEPIARESRPPSPVYSTVRERNLVSSVVNRLGDLEKQVETLHSKRHEMPREKEELLNTAVYRVDALEAELIATKKVRTKISQFHVKLFPLTD